MLWTALLLFRVHVCVCVCLVASQERDQSAFVEDTFFFIGGRTRSVFMKMLLEQLVFFCYCCRFVLLLLVSNDATNRKAKPCFLSLKFLAFYPDERTASA